MDSKVVFIDHPYYAVNNPSNNLRIYKKNKKDEWYYIQCKDLEHYRKEIKKYILGFYDYSRDEKKAKTSMFDYYMGSKKSEDVMERNKMRREEMAMLKDGTFIKDDMVEDMKKEWSNYLDNSNTQLAVLSLYQDYVDENINIKDLQKEVATSLLPKLFNYCGYENPKENLEWIVSLHSDRENNYHFHIAWIEKNKCYKLKNNKLGHRYKLKLDENENNFMKRQVSLAIERSKLYRPALIKINEDIEHLQKYFNPKDQNFTLKNINDLDLEEEIVRLGYLLSEIRNTDKKYIKYNSLPRNEVGNEIRSLTNDIKKKIFLSSNDIQLSKDEINKSIEKLNDIFLDIDKRNNISNAGFESAFDNKMIKDKLEKSDNYILNAIVNHANYINKHPKISEDELLQNIVYKNYKKNRQTRFNILSNYLSTSSRSSKFKNQYKIKQAVKNINDELEDAQKEFDKLFKVDKEYE